MRKPKIHELTFVAAVCDQRIDGRVVQVGDDPREILGSQQCRRLAAWLIRAAEWIEAQKEAAR